MQTRSFSEIIDGAKPVLVDFSAAWCGPCKMMVPILKQLKETIGDSATVLKVDVDNNPALANAYSISGVPTLILFREGHVLWRQSGVVPAHELERVIEKYKQ